MQASVKVLLPAALVLGLALGFAWGHDRESASDGEVLDRIERAQDDLRRAVERLASREEAVTSPACPPAPRPIVQAVAPPVTQTPPVTQAPPVQAQPVEAQVALSPRVSEEDVFEHDSAEGANGETLAVRDECLRLIDTAVRAREWGDAEAARLRILLEQLTTPQRGEVLERLTALFNAGTLRVTTRGAPY